MELESIFDIILQKHQEKTGQNETEARKILYTNFMEEYPIVTTTFLCLILVGIAFGICGNILIIGGVTAYRKLRTTGNMFIVNLAVADLIVVTTVLPFNVIGVIVGPRFFLGKMEGLCHMVATVCVMSCAGSMMTLASVSVNRFIFVCKNLKYNTIYTKKKTLMYIGLIWIIVALVDLPNYLGWGAHTFDFKTMGCVFDRGYFNYTMFLSTLIYWIPLSLVIFCYITIFVYVRKHNNDFKRQIAKQGPSNSANSAIMQARREQDIRMIRTFVLVVIIFVLCWVPYFILVLFDREEKMSTGVYCICLAIGHTNSSINSILYGATNKKFRIGYKIFLVRYCCRCLPSIGKMKEKGTPYIINKSNSSGCDIVDTNSSSLPASNNI